MKVTAMAEGKCPICAALVDGKLGSHLREQHGEEQFRAAVLDAKARGTRDAKIGARFGISFRQLEGIITQAYGTNISVLERPKRIKSWAPKNFREETTTVWSFRQRGNWATHDGRYRGNWSPYIPRNIILRYSKPGEVVLDYFAGGGTTAVEAKLLGRRCIMRDINPAAVNLTLQNLAFDNTPSLFEGEVYEPEVSIGDARDLSDIADGTIDLVCAHPPYAGIINYSSAVEGDLSRLTVTDFLTELGKVARESLRVLKPGGKCAILIGDARKSKHVVPIGFQTVRAFLDAGFVLKELIIKRQHNCKTTGFWYSRSIQHNFLLLAHEYLPVFEKPGDQQHQARQLDSLIRSLPIQVTTPSVHKAGDENIETTTVWIIPRDRLEADIRRNLLQRFAFPDAQVAEFRFDVGDSSSRTIPADLFALVRVCWPQGRITDTEILNYRTAVTQLSEQAGNLIAENGYFALEAEDFRIGQTYWPAGMLLYEDMAGRQDLALKEIVIVMPEQPPVSDLEEHLEIVHRYLLIYTRR